MNITADMLWFIILIVIFYIISALVHAVLLAFYKGDPSRVSIRRKRNDSARTLIVLGSGVFTLKILMRF